MVFILSVECHRLGVRGVVVAIAGLFADARRTGKGPSIPGGSIALTPGHYVGAESGVPTQLSALRHTIGLDPISDPSPRPRRLSITQFRIPSI